MTISEQRFMETVPPTLRGIRDALTEISKAITPSKNFVLISETTYVDANEICAVAVLDGMVSVLMNNGKTIPTHFKHVEDFANASGLPIPI